MNLPWPPLLTTRLCFRRAALTDAAFVLEITNDPAWIRFTGDRGIRTLAAAATYIETKLWHHEAAHGFAMGVVERRDDATPVGLAGFIQREHLPHPDLGYGLLARFAGHGYTTEICRALMAERTARWGIDRVIAFTSPDNHGSQAVLRKLGFHPDHTTVEPQTGAATLIYTNRDRSDA